MRLTLTYDGLLPSANNKNPRTPEKNDIRRYFHPQIEEAFQGHPALGNGESFKFWKSLAPEMRYGNQPNQFLRGRKVGRYCFLPLVTRHHHMICELDVLFLRREQPGSLVHNGDLDNRLKVLFDGLRMPLTDSELEGLKEDEPEPLCCLLADDSLITAVNLRTEQWYEAPAPNTSAANIRLVIEVLIRVTRLTYSNIGLGG